MAKTSETKKSSGGKTALLSTKYDPQKTESQWYARWEAAGLFVANPHSTHPAFSIVIPPPNVTGSLHIGHALNNTLQDILCRQKRMQGYDVLWVPGCDHAGIATQNVVERALAKEGKSRYDLGQAKFVERVWQWKQEYGGTIMHQLRRLGCSLDWSRERFTMDAQLSAAVREVFVSLYQDGLIYRGDYIINWCPRCQTALSDIESEHVEVDGHLWYIQYPLVQGAGSVLVATTRPETMLGDTAVAVHPADERYQALIGQSVRLPLMQREIPIVADDYVDRNFGTGVVKITPAHDPNDFWVAERHGLPRIKVMNPNATMSTEAGPYAGLDRFECRQRVLADLEQQGWLVKKEDHRHAVGHCYRCHTMVEPYLSRQWFVKMKPLAEPAIAAVEQGKISFIPSHWAKHYLEWMANLRDWCISRQIWWGHRIPAWYCEACGQVQVAREAPSQCSQCGHSRLQQDPDVLDTWFSSALWPFSTLGWPEATAELQRYYPTSVLVTSWDIIFFWVARMIMMGLKFCQQVPFHIVCINSLVGDAEGKKMSKSRGNTVDPLDIMEHTGADGLRFTMAAIETQSRYVAFTAERLESSRNFANKIWNAARFALMHLEDYTLPPLAPAPDFVDLWIQSRLQKAVNRVNQALQDFRFAEAAQALYEFIWHEFCDWYVELCKMRLNVQGPEYNQVRYYLLKTLEEMLRLLHPFMPFITEELWSYLPGERDFIMRSTWPEPVGETEADHQLEQTMDILQQVVFYVRQKRGEMNVHPSQLVSLLIRPLPGQAALGEMVEKHSALVCQLGKVSQVQVAMDMPKPRSSATAVTQGLELFIPLEGIIDLDKERARLSKEISQLSQLIKRLEGKLSDTHFLARAPQDVVEKEKEKKTVYSQQLQQLQANRLNLG